MNKFLKKVTKTVKYVIKDGDWYRPIYFDETNNRCVIRIISNHNDATEENTKTYDEVCELYDIEFEGEKLTPDKYFLRKLEDSKNLCPVVTGHRLINYINENMDKCEPVISKLKEIVMSHQDMKVRKGAYSTLKKLEIEEYEELEKYLIQEKAKKDFSISDGKLRLDAIISEKTLIVYMSLVKRYKDNRSEINCSKFIKMWDEMFPYNMDDHQTKVKAHQQAHIALDVKSLEEIQEYRNTFSIYESTEVPEDIKHLAQEKSVVVLLAENRNKHLSGFDVQIKGAQNHLFRINEIPFGLTEKSVYELLQRIPTKSELKKKEAELMSVLKSEETPLKQKKAEVGKYNAVYATHDFIVFMNRFTIKQCKDSKLTRLCVDLCNRCNINNLQNNAPIVYKFCEGSGERERSLKRIGARRKGNAKAAKKRK